MSAAEVRGGRAVQSLVRRVQLALGAIVGGQAVLYGVAVGLVVGSLAGIWVGVASGVIVAGVVAWRSRSVGSAEHAALWVEERDPTLQYTLVTAVDARYAGRSARGYSGPLLRRAGVRGLGPAVAAVLVAASVHELIVWRHLAVFHHNGARGNGAAAAAAVVPVNRLVPLTAHVVPPAYSHQAARDLKEPTTIASLVGSDITLRGKGDTVGLVAALGTVPVRVGGEREGWGVKIAMPDKAALVRLTDGARTRLIVLAPIIDAPPTVELTEPARDSVMREAHGVLRLAALASDDIGLADGEFEIIVSSGSEDEGGVHGKTLSVGHVAFQDARGGEMSGGFALDSLKPGEIVSIRAVVRDGNTVTGPGVGTSETRTYRLATKQEYDSIAIEGAPPPGLDSSYMSQRMIVMKTQALLKRMVGRHPVVRDTVVAVSRKLGHQEDQLKGKLSNILHGGDQGQGEAMSQAERVLFDTALAAMTDASMSLAIAEAKEALPRELVALAALDTVRMMQHRVYLRGQPPVIVVNLARIRLKGTSRPDAGVRAAEAADDTVRRSLGVALGRILAGSGSLVRPGVADSLTVLQVEALGVDPALAGALGDAASAVRTGDDPGPALGKVRRLLTGGATVDSVAATWGGGGG